MLKYTLRSLWAAKRRLIATFLSAVLGVAFMGGTLVFTDTIDQVFDDLFAQVTEEVDTVVQGEVLFESGFPGLPAERANIDPALADAVAEVEGVVAAEPFALLATASLRLLDTEGDPVGATQGPPTLIESWVQDEAISPYTLTDGSRPPGADDEIAVNVAAAEDGGYQVGDEVVVYTQEGERTFELVGTFRFGSAESSAGAVSLDFTLATASELIGTPGRVQAIFARGDGDIDPETLTGRIEEVIAGGAEAVTGDAYADQVAQSVSGQFSAISQLVQVFAFVALVVGGFIIYNTFQILVAQRTRELALLRAIGADRHQVLGSTMVEAVLIAVVSAAAGTGVGVALASAVFGAFSSGGADLPTDSVALVPGTLLFAFGAGVAITLVAAVVPAIRATRVSPLAAMRDVAVDRSGASRVRAVAGAVLMVLAVFLVTRAVGSGGDTDLLPSVGLGALLAIVAAIVLGPVLASPSARVLGGVIPRLAGVPGRLAVENAARSPKRTAATASALMIPVVLMAFILTIATSATESFTSEAERGFSADVFLYGGGGLAFTGFSPSLTEAIGGLDGVAVSTAQKGSPAQVTWPDEGQGETFIGSLDPGAFSRVAEPDMTEGDIADLSDGGVIVDRHEAEREGVGVGDEITLTFPGGATRRLTIEGIGDDLVVLFPLNITEATFNEAVPTPLDLFGFVQAEDGADAGEVLAAVEDLAEREPTVDVLDRDGFVDSIAGQFLAIITLLFVLLAFSVIIAFVGVYNTLSLSVVERTREIGLLRAVGATRRQLRSSMRWEATIIAVLGPVVGVALGLLCAWGVVSALAGFGLVHFVVPVVALGVVLVVAAVFGVVAALLPAYKASRLDLLAAIATA